MDLIEEHNKKWNFFKEINGFAIQVYNKYHYGLFESAYQAALRYLLSHHGYKVEKEVYLPIYWDDVKLDESYRMDLVINGNIIIELKTVKFISTEHRKQLWSYMNITHLPYGMLINYSPTSLYSEWYYRHDNGEIEKIKLL